jgi:hypothetical protein
MSMKNSNDTIGNQTRALKACSAVCLNQLRHQQRAPLSNCTFSKADSSGIMDNIKRLPES